MLPMRSTRGGVVTEAMLYAFDLLERVEGIVSKRLSKPYQSGRSGHWLKVKNPESPAMARARQGTW